MTAERTNADYNALAKTRWLRNEEQGSRFSSSDSIVLSLL